MIPRSLRARLVAAALGSILAALAAFGVAAVAITGQELHSSLDRALEQRARDVARLSVSAPAVLTTPGALEAPVGGRQVVVEVLDGRRRILARSLSLGARILPHDSVVDRALVAGRPGFENLQLGDRPLRLYAAPLPDTGGPAAGGVVLVASETSDIARTLHRLHVLLALAALATALLAALAAALLTRRGLAPLRRLSAAARDIERTSDPARRLPDARAEDEIGELTRVLNGMLTALDRARSSERRFLADASHELRTPVTALLGNIEYAVRHGADAELLGELRHDAARLARLIDDLLTLERESAGAERVPLRADALVRDAAERHQRVALGRVDPASVEGDAEALRRALANLIENALVHGPPDAPVDLSLRHEGGCVLIAVHDRGPGPPEDERDQLFERFFRGRDAARRPGSGLGLPIAASIMEDHGGRVRVEGSTFTLELPASERQPAAEDAQTGSSTTPAGAATCRAS